MTANCFSLSNVLVFVGMALICTVVSADEPKAGESKWLDTLRPKDDADAAPLALVQIQRLHPPLTLTQILSVGEQYKTILPKGENRYAFTDPVGSMAFMVMRPKAGLCANSLDGEQVVGLVYAHALHKDERPQAYWSGRLIHSHPMDQIYLVLARSEGYYLTLAIFPIDPERKIGKYPLEFPLAKLDRWPKPLQTATEKVIRVHRKVSADVHDICVVPDKKSLVIAAQVMDKTVTPHYFRYDFDQKTWTRTNVVDGDSLE